MQKNKKKNCLLLLYPSPDSVESSLPSTLLSCCLRFFPMMIDYIITSPHNVDCSNISCTHNEKKSEQRSTSALFLCSRRLLLSFPRSRDINNTQLHGDIRCALADCWTAKGEAKEMMHL